MVLAQRYGFYQEKKQGRGIIAKILCVLCDPHLVN